VVGYVSSRMTILSNLSSPRLTAPSNLLSEHFCVPQLNENSSVTLFLPDQLLSYTKAVNDGREKQGTLLVYFSLVSIGIFSMYLLP